MRLQAQFSSKPSPLSESTDWLPVMSACALYFLQSRRLLRWSKNETGFKKKHLAKSNFCRKHLSLLSYLRRGYALNYTLRRLHKLSPYILARRTTIRNVKSESCKVMSLKGLSRTLLWPDRESWFASSHAMLGFDEIESGQSVWLSAFFVSITIGTPRKVLLRQTNFLRAK